MCISTVGIGEGSPVGLFGSLRSFHQGVPVFLLHFL